MNIRNFTNFNKRSKFSDEEEADEPKQAIIEEVVEEDVLEEDPIDDDEPVVQAAPEPVQVRDLQKSGFLLFK